MAVLATIMLAFALPIAPLPFQWYELIVNLTGWSLLSAWGVTSIVKRAVVLFAILFVTRQVEKRSLDSVALKAPSIGDIAGAVATFIAWEVLTMSLALLVEPSVLRLLGAGSVTASSSPHSAAAVIGSLPVSLQLAMAVSNGFVEELGCHAYAIERITEFTGRLWVGAGIAYVLDIAIHVPFWGVEKLLFAIPGELLLVGFYLWRRNLPASASAHILIDGLPGAWPGVY